jgi:hypothetical protein
MTDYYETPNGFVGISDEYPRGMKGVIFIGRGPKPGGGIGSVHEQAYGANEIRKWKRVDRVPPEWMEAIGYEEQTVTELVIDMPGDNLRRKMNAKPGTRDYEEWQKEKVPLVIIAIVAALISWWHTFGF